jgi:6-phosphogluconate dehydrogenase
MQLGMIGLGRMGANLARRLMRDGHQVVVHDVDPSAVTALVAEGAEGASDLADLAEKLVPPRAVWVMVPAGIAGRVIDDVAGHLDAGRHRHRRRQLLLQDDLHRSADLAEGDHSVDVGTSGGVFGLERASAS